MVYNFSILFIFCKPCDLVLRNTRGGKHVLHSTPSGAKAAGLSYRGLAQLVGVSHAAIKKYEDGIAMPSSGILIRLSHTLKVRSEYFFRPEKHVLENIEYRKHHSLPKKRLEAITYEVMDHIERRIELEDLFPRPPIKTFATVDGLASLITEIDQIESVSERVREA